MFFNRRFKKELAEKDIVIANLEKALDECRVERNFFEKTAAYYTEQLKRIKNTINEVSPTIKLNAIKVIRDIVELEE